MVEDSNKPVLLAFKATGILESRSYRLEIRPPASIIVGPNGTGKSTFLSLFYLFVSRQWQRLNEFDFDTLTLIHSRGSVSLNKTDLLSFEVTPTQPGGLGHAIARFQERGAMDLLYKSSLTKEEREQFSAISRFPVDQITSFRRYLQKELGFTKRAYEVDAEVAALGFGEILYLPTYRRIEKDIRSIFPDIENRIRNKIADGYMTPRTGAGFKEIAGFGMADIQQIVDRYTSDIRDYRRQVSETASQEYIRDIITGKSLFGKSRVSVSAHEIGPHGDKNHGL
ncbi:hypothetical protein JK185_11470 [Gluconobacter wancherniae]|uniref:hypothetical protein n=1 Tax=Gluconobacter wancherniae TaxID=1307955 RepID=UPI001B8CB21F|nr:hypothetical protein [Gluconobacter wancherniae]MBS1063655.1 hypothetical protein [Gluconobacter wancherniae]